MIVVFQKSHNGVVLQIFTSWIFVILEKLFLLVWGFNWSKLLKQHNNNLSLHSKYLLVQTNKTNTRKRCEIHSKLTKKTPERRLVSLLLTSAFLCVSIVAFEQMNVCCTVIKTCSYLKNYNKHWMGISLKVKHKHMTTISIHTSLYPRYLPIDPTGIYLNTITTWVICSKLTTKKPDRRNWRRSSVFLTLNTFLTLLHCFLC